METHFWTEETDKAILTWIKGKGADETLYLDHIYHPLWFFARYIIGEYGKSFPDKEKEDLGLELISQASVGLLQSYDPKKSTNGTVMPFVHQIMKNHLYSKYSNSISKKRIGTLVSIEGMNEKKDTESPDDYLDWFLATTSGEDTTNINKDTTQIVCRYIKENAHFHFQYRTLKNVLLIVDVIEHPENHNIQDKTYSHYLCERMGVTKQRLSQLLNKVSKMVKPHLKTLLEQ